MVMPNRNLRVVKAGERTNPQGKSVRNRILLALPDNEYRSIRPGLEFLELPHHLGLYEPNRKIEFIYFPNSGLISLVVVMEDGKTVEVGVLGIEGFTGVPSIFGLLKSPIREVVQIAGDGFRIESAVLQQYLRCAPELRVLLGRYATVLGMQVSQTAACNRLHDIERRLARWLLMAQDRVDTGLLVITHDFLATMLGTDRPSVSLAAGQLQKRRIIDYPRGAVRIVNRKKLEEAACECYQVIQQLNGAVDLK
jgi:CRP-like cAMP-binding protein